MIHLQHDTFDAMSERELKEALLSSIGPEYDWSHLLSGDLLHRVYAVMAAQYTETGHLLAARKAALIERRQEIQESGAGGRVWEREHAEYAGWRRRTLGFLNLVNARLDEAASMRRRLMANEHAHRGVVRELALAISAHRKQCTRLDIEPEPHDEALWAVLGSLQVPLRQGTASLSSLLATAWTPFAPREETSDDDA